MKLQMKLAMVLGALALAVAPAMALAGTAGDHGQGNAYGHGPKYHPAPPETPGPGAGLPEKAKAYGVYCQGLSKKHVEGQKGTPFSQCVNAMAKAAVDDDVTPREACKGLSKKHVKGKKGTDFSRCVVAAAKLRQASQA
jgi:hypothetical protein